MTCNQVLHQALLHCSPAMVPIEPSPGAITSCICTSMHAWGAQLKRLHPVDAFWKVVQFWPQMLAEATTEVLRTAELSPYRVLATI